MSCRAGPVSTMLSEEGLSDFPEGATPDQVIIVSPESFRMLRLTLPQVIFSFELAPAVFGCCIFGSCGLRCGAEAAVERLNKMHCRSACQGARSPGPRPWHRPRGPDRVTRTRSPDRHGRPGIANLTACPFERLHDRRLHRDSCAAPRIKHRHVS